ncbi:Hypothetical predicted protein [Cloeon dipterum]|uniref:Secreted protein n=1 Tax=Cloeon dipterum TaxID=197152 RepID=A0A8S1E4W7_9INSE|nr:Hypothetical predicted protein [Cloeon dipterum]
MRRLSGMAVRSVVLVVLLTRFSHAQSPLDELSEVDKPNRYRERRTINYSPGIWVRLPRNFSPPNSRTKTAFIRIFAAIN